MATLKKKLPNRTPSIRQKRVARAIATAMTSPEPPTGGEIVESAGYGPSARLFPGRILESKGVRKELKELGFSVEAADTVVWELLHKSPKIVRLAAAREVYKRMGAYKDTEQGAPKTLVVTGNGITFKKFNGTGGK